MAANKRMRAVSALKEDDLIVIAGAGGFIAGALARYFHDEGFARIRAIDKKLLPEWHQRVPGVECLCLDLSVEANCRQACEGAVEVYNLAAEIMNTSLLHILRRSPYPCLPRCRDRMILEKCRGRFMRTDGDPRAKPSSKGR